MRLDKKPLQKAPDAALLRRLYHAAFPKEEQMPWWILRLTPLRRDMGVGGTFRVLSTKPKLDVDAYLRAFGKLSFGLWKPYVRKGEDYGTAADA